MPLPGKLIIGFLEEDNPVKAFFRIRPMWAQDGEKGYFLNDMDQKYLEDGFIRIVPDKNELAVFKGRMRSLGRYCALDLRNFPGENEKIRPNKNYGMGAERNAFIVYSDVIGPVAQETAMEVLDGQYVFVSEEVTLRCAAPGTKYVLLKREGQLLGPWIWSEAQDVAGCITLRHAPGIPMRMVAEEEAREHLFLMELDNVQVWLMTCPGLFDVTAAAGQEQPREAEKPSVPEQPASRAEAAPPIPVKEEEKALAPAEDTPAPAQSAPVQSAPTPARQSPAAPVNEAAPVKSAPVPAEKKEEPAQETAKPWIQKTDLGPKLKAISGRLSLREQALQAQTGINPRRGRSLSEVVDEQWRHSRYEQLGHPVPPDATGRPVVTPIDRAHMAVKEAWSIPDARQGLIGVLLKDEELRRALSQQLKIQASQAQGTDDQRMEELEADKLKLIAEIDALRIRRNDMKAQLMEDLRKSHQRDFETLKQRNQALQAQIERNQERAREAAKAAQAEKELLQKTSADLLREMVAQAAALQAAQRAIKGENGSEGRQLALYHPTPSQLVSDLRVYMEKAGLPMDNAQAVDMLLCLLAGDIMILSGPSGSGKSYLARQLAAALGLTRKNGCFLQCASLADQTVEAMLEKADDLTPCMIVVEDVNLPDAGGAVQAALRLKERARAQGLGVYIVLTVQDGPEGLPLSPRLLNHAFLLRMQAPDAGQSWRSVGMKPAPAEKTVELAALKEMVRCGEAVPAVIEERMNRLRQALEKLGYRMDRRTLSDVWAYCAVMTRMGRTEDMETLDMALCHRALPVMLADMELHQLLKLGDLLPDMPRCLALLAEPLPLPPLA